MQIKQTLLVLTTFAIAGCSLFGPDYAKPEIDAPKNWAHAKNIKLIHGQVNLSDVSWWETFNDPVLNQLITDALKNNNNIQMAIGNIGIAKAQLQQVNMSWVPTIALGGAVATGQVFNLAANSSNPLVNNAVPGISNFTFYQGGLVPTYSLNIFRQLKQHDIAKASVAAAKSAKDSVRLAIISQVAGSYFTILALDEQLQEQKQVVKDLTEVVKLTKIQYDYGYASLTDIEQYEEQLQKSKMEIPGIEKNLVYAQNALQVLLNKNPGDIVRSGTFAKINITGKVPANLPSDVLLNRPDIMQAEEQLQMANADIGAAKANYFPSITLTSPVGAFSTQLTGLFNPAGDFWMTQIAATMPILNLGLNALIKEKKSKYYVAYYNYIQTVRNSFSEVDNSLVNVAKLRDTSAEASKLYAIAKKSANLNTENYKSGYTSYLESLSSKVTLDNTKIMLTQVKLQQLQATINVYQAMAGGYNYQNTDQAKKFGDGHDV